jgi:Mrp family chromosome partitioning ATPase/uncharacterized protein involved in exopolysaccharide biosynthesis
MNASPEASAATTAPPNLATGAFMPLVSLRRHRRIGLIVMAVSAVLGLTVTWLKGNQYVYTATATLYVAPRFVNILQESKEVDIASYQQFRQFIEHQALTVGRFDILLDALLKLGDKRKTWQLPHETERQAAERLQASLKAVAVKDSYLITVNLENDNQDGLAELINSVVDTFIAKVQSDEFFYARDARLENLREHRKHVESNILEKTEQRTRIAQELGVTTFVETAVNPFDQLLLDTQTALANAQRERLVADANLALFEDAHGKINQDALTAAIFDNVAKDAGLNALKSDFHLRRSKFLEQISGLDDQHPLKQKIGHELKELDDELTKAVKEETDKVAKAFLDQRRTEAQKARRLEQDIKQQLDTHLQKAAWFASRYNAALVLTNDIQRGRKQLETIDNRIEYFEMESHAPGFVRVESYARPPEKPIKGGRKKRMMIAVLASVVLGLAVPVLIDMTDRRIKNANQAQKILGYPILAGLFELSEDIDVRRVIADQKRRLALALAREQQQRNTRLILLTSVKPAAGVTGLAFDLALEFGEIGLKTLVIETNPLKPDSRYQASVLPVGLLDLLTGDLTPEQAIIEADGFLPDRISIGLPVNSHLFAYNRLRDILTTLKQRYDIILLDAPPLLLSGDTEFLVSMADLTLLLIGANQVLPGELKRAAGILQKIDPPAVSFIVTHVQIYQGGGYFSNMVKEYQQSEVEAKQIIRSNPLSRTSE